MKMSKIASAACLVILAAAMPALGEGYLKWDAVNEGLDLGSGKGVTDVAVGGKTTVVYVIVDGVGLLKSDDLGAKWSAVAGDAVKNPYMVAVAPEDGSVFVAPTEAGKGVFKSADGGKTFEAVAGLSGDVESLAFSIKDPKLMLAGFRAGKEIAVSADGGKTWKKSDLGADMKSQVVLIVDDMKWVVATRAGGAIRYTENAGEKWDAGTGDVGYFEGHLPIAQAGEYLFVAQHHGLAKSTDGGKAFKFEIGPHVRVLGTLGNAIFRENRAEIRGTQDHIIAPEMSDNYGQSWSDASGALVSLIPAATKSVAMTTSPFAHEPLATAWAGSPDGKAAFMGIGKAGLYRLQLISSNKGPRMVSPELAPPAIPEGDSVSKITLRVIVSARNADVKKVYADLGALGLPALELFNDSAHGSTDNKQFANKFSLPKKAAAGDKMIGLIAEDKDGNLSALTAKFVISAASEELIVWDGDKFSHGQSWVSPQSPLNYIKAVTDEGSFHNGKVGLEFHGEGAQYIGGGWNWQGWYPADSGTDIRNYRNLSFWCRVEGPKKPDDFSVSLTCSPPNVGKPTKTVAISEYSIDGTIMDGKWHHIVIPLTDMYDDKGFNPAKAWEIDFSKYSAGETNVSLFVDEIGFSNMLVRAKGEWVTLPEERAPKALAADAAKVTAEVDIKADGQPISPYIYGEAAGEHKAAKEMGITTLRVGGNPLSPVDWKTGYGAKGADWFYTNEGTLTPPEKSWLTNFFGTCKADGFEAYLSIPCMGRVAKDATSVGFDIDKYPNQTDWVGKHQPSDPHPKGGNGLVPVFEEDGKTPKKDDKGNVITQPVDADPNDASIAKTPEEQTEILKFMVENMKYGTADKGGLKYVCLDNEPDIWQATHRAMHPKGMTYDDMWEMTRTYAIALKKIDPAVKVAGPTWSIWSTYFLSGRDLQECGAGKAKWADPPDFVAHNREPISKWLLKKCAEYEKANGQRLLDVFDFHFYPQTGIYQGGTAGDPKVMEERVQQTRVLWDPEYVDTSWMAGDPNGAKVGGKLQIIRMFKQWVTECYPGTKLALGEYNWGGEKDISGGIAEAELLGIFAREGLDRAYLWFSANPNGPLWFAFKMFRNPDGKFTAFGDRYLPSKVSAQDDISVHAAKDSKTGQLSFVIVNKRAAKDAKLTLKLSKAVPEQDVTVYEYSNADRNCIGQLPARKVSGESIELDVPSMAVLRFDLKP
jgi:hypothetical protein